MTTPMPDERDVWIADRLLRHCAKRGEVIFLPHHLEQEYRDAMACADQTRQEDGVAPALGESQPTLQTPVMPDAPAPSTAPTRQGGGEITMRWLQDWFARIYGRVRNETDLTVGSTYMLIENDKETKAFIASHPRPTPEARLVEAIDEADYAMVDGNDAGGPVPKETVAGWLRHIRHALDAAGQEGR